MPKLTDAAAEDGNIPPIEIAIEPIDIVKTISSPFHLPLLQNFGTSSSKPH
jgi:hypothetical protein